MGRHEAKQGGLVPEEGSGIDFMINRKANEEKVIAPLRAENLAMNVKSRMDASIARSNALGLVISPMPPSKPEPPSENNNNRDSKMEPSFGDHLSEMNKLRDEISMLKKVIAQKDKVILAKDKKINEFNAEKWDKDKLQKVKVGQMQKDFDTQMGKLRIENGKLIKEVTALKKKKEKYEARSEARSAAKIRLSAYKIQTPGSPAGERSDNDSSSERKDIESTPAIVKKDLANELDNALNEMEDAETKKEEVKEEGKESVEKEKEDVDSTKKEEVDEGEDGDVKGGDDVKVEDKEDEEVKDKDLKVEKKSDDEEEEDKMEEGEDKEEKKESDEE